MTITTNDTRNEYTATASQTVFNYTFKIFESTDLNVYQTPAGQTPADTDLITAYTVVGEGLSAGGSITLNVAATIGDLITIVSDVPESRTTDYQFNGDFIPDTVNDDFDRVVSLAKQSQSIIGRTPQFPEATQNATGLSWEAPEVGGFIRWKSDLSGLENIQLNTAVGADNAAAISYDNTASGLSSTDVQGAIDEIDTTLDATGTSLSALTSAVGVSPGDTNMGEYTGGLITDDQSAKENIQELEAAIEVNSNEIDNVKAFNGYATQDGAMGSNLNVTLPYSGSYKIVVMTAFFSTSSWTLRTDLSIDETFNDMVCQTIVSERDTDVTQGFSGNESTITVSEIVNLMNNNTADTASGSSATHVVGNSTLYGRGIEAGSILTINTTVTGSASTEIEWVSYEFLGA